jgi:hypothetical protein
MELLAQSANYQVLGEYETVFLKSGERLVVIGDFYGDAHGAYVDPQERWCVIIGCGLIVYYLREPFEAYRYNQETPQWYEFGRDPANIYWFESVVAGADCDALALTAEGQNGGTYRLTVPPAGGEPILEVLSRLCDPE